MTRRGLITGHVIVGSLATAWGAVCMEAHAHPAFTFVNGALAGVNFTRAYMLALH